MAIPLACHPAMAPCVLSMPASAEDFGVVLPPGNTLLKAQPVARLGPRLQRRGIAAQEEQDHGADGVGECLPGRISPLEGTCQRLGDTRQGPFGASQDPLVQGRKAEGHGRELEAGRRAQVRASLRRQTGDGPFETAVRFLRLAHEVVEKAGPKVGEGSKGLVIPFRRLLEHLPGRGEGFLELPPRRQHIQIRV
jgi:hypothetical protein